LTRLSQSDFSGSPHSAEAGDGFGSEFVAGFNGWGIRARLGRFFFGASRTGNRRRPGISLGRLLVIQKRIF
jgi:hypothetical protein